jgi:hypothetical protein
MFFNDHAPPHFHARYGEFEVTIDIDMLSVIKGELPRRALELRTGMGDDTQRRTVGQLAALPGEPATGED